MNKQLICELFDKGMISFGNAILKNGKATPIYIQMRRLPSFPEILVMVAEEILRKIHSEQFLGTRLAGLPMSGLPIAVAMGVIGKMPVLYPRQQERMGQMNVEGFYRPDDTVIAVDDVLTDGAIKRHQIKLIRNTGLDVRDLIVVVDRQEGGEKVLEEDRIRVHSLTNLREIVEVLRSDANLGNYEYDRCQKYFQGGLNAS